MSDNALTSKLAAGKTLSFGKSSGTRIWGFFGGWALVLAGGALIYWLATLPGRSLDLRIGLILLFAGIALFAAGVDRGEYARESNGAYYGSGCATQCAARLGIRHAAHRVDAAARHQSI